MFDLDSEMVINVTEQKNNALNEFCRFIKGFISVFDESGGNADYELTIKWSPENKLTLYAYSGGSFPLDSNWSAGDMIEMMEKIRKFPEGE